MSGDWVNVFSSSALHTIELLRQILSQSDIDSVVLNQQDSFYVTIGEINLLVKRDDVIKAKKIISEALT